MYGQSSCKHVKVFQLYQGKSIVNPKCKTVQLDTLNRIWAAVGLALKFSSRNDCKTYAVHYKSLPDGLILSNIISLLIYYWFQCLILSCNLLCDVQFTFFGSRFKMSAALEMAPPSPPIQTSCHFDENQKLSETSHVRPL